MGTGAGKDCYLKKTIWAGGNRWVRWGVDRDDLARKPPNMTYWIATYCPPSLFGTAQCLRRTVLAMTERGFYLQSSFISLKILWFAFGNAKSSNSSTLTHFAWVAARSFSSPDRYVHQKAVIWILKCV